MTYFDNCAMLLCAGVIGVVLIGHWDGFVTQIWQSCIKSKQKTNSVLSKSINKLYLYVYCNKEMQTDDAGHSQNVFFPLF